MIVNFIQARTIKTQIKNVTKARNDPSLKPRIRYALKKKKGSPFVNWAVTET